MRARLTSLACVVLVASGSASATLAKRWLPELLDETDLAVVGTLRNVREWREGNLDHGAGTLEAEVVVFGPRAAGDALALKWRNASEDDCNRVEHGKRNGIRALWLLQIDGDGSVYANYPGRAVPLADPDSIARAKKELAGAPTESPKVRSIQQLLDGLQATEDRRRPTTR